jgi:hypothetical protein
MTLDYYMILTALGLLEAFRLFVYTIPDSIDLFVPE